MTGAKKHLGQNFLRSKSALKDILSAAELNEKETVVEVGPGEGFLTEGLLSKALRVIAIEKDYRLVSILKEKFASEIKNGKLILVEGDIRDFSPSRYKLNVTSYKLVANIPYYITGEIIRFFLENNFQPASAVLMVQKEVAERIIARNKKESILSISVKAYGTPKIIRTVGRGNFSPPPKVDSAILKIENISKKLFSDFSEDQFFSAVKLGFAHKRKKLAGNLSAKFGKETIDKLFNYLGMSKNTRAEDLTIKNWIDMASFLFKIGLSSNHR